MLQRKKAKGQPSLVHFLLKILCYFVLDLIITESEEIARKKTCCVLQFLFSVFSLANLLAKKYL